MLVRGYSVLVKNFSSGNPYLFGVVYSMTGPALFTIDLTDGRRVRRHLDQVRKNTSTNVVDGCPTTTEMNDTTETNDDFYISVPNSLTVESPPSDVPPRASKDYELRHSDHTRYPPQCFVSDIN